MYDRTLIENSKTVVLQLNYQDVTSVTQQLFLEFVPDEVVVKNITANFHDTSFDISIDPIFLSSDLVNSYNNLITAINFYPFLSNSDFPITGGDGDAIQYINVSNLGLDIPFRIPNFTNRNYTFYINNMANDLDMTNSTMFMSVALVFNQYKKVHN
jgi:hypothetical protein